MRRITIGFAALAAATLIAAAPPAHADFVSTVLGTNPLDFWTLNSPNANSLGVGTDSSTYNNGVGTVAAGSGLPQQSNAASFDGLNNSTPQYVSTGLTSTISGGGSIMAWVNLAALPAANDFSYYIAGRGQSGNDFELTMEHYTGISFYANGITYYNPSTTGLVGTWHQVVGTYTDGATGSRNIYWDGALVAHYNGALYNSPKTAPFTIGDTTAFYASDFDGMIADVGVWGTALTGDQVAAIYDAAVGAPVGVPEPASVAILMVAVLGLFGLRRRLV